MEIISIINSKGGVGKSTVTIALGDSLSRKRGMCVCVLDFDPQASLSGWLGLRNEARNLYPYLVQNVNGLSEGQIDLKDVVHTVRKGLDAIPASIKMAILDDELDDPALWSRFWSDLDDLGYTHVVVDTPPNLGVWSVSAALAATKIVIPIEPSFMALDAVGTVEYMLETLRADYPDANIPNARILVNRFDGRLKHENECYDMIKDHFKKRVIGDYIPQSVRLEEAAMTGKLPVDIAHVKLANAIRRVTNEVSK